MSPTGSGGRGAQDGIVARQHRDTLSALERYLDACAAEQDRALARCVIAYVAEHPDATTRGCRPDHVTASAVVVSPDARHVMLDLHGKAHRWLQFGGHVEDTDATLADAALREAVEESGCTDVELWSREPALVDVHPAPCGARQHLDVQFVAVAPAGARPVRSEESHDVAWFPVDALPPDADASVRRLVAQAVERVLGGPSSAPTPSS